MVNRYAETYAAWRRDPLNFLAEAAKEIDWIQAPQNIFNAKAGVYGRWFPDATCNTCWNALDRHVAAGQGARIAFVYDSPLSGTKRKLSYSDTLLEVATLAAVLQDFGVSKGDRVLIYMPMIPETVFAMLACARIGAVHSVVFGGFASKELAIRINDAAPKLILTASCGLEPKRVAPYKPLVDEAISLAKFKPDAILLFQRPEAQIRQLIDVTLSAAKFERERRSRDRAATLDRILLEESLTTVFEPIVRLTSREILGFEAL